MNIHEYQAKKLLKKFNVPVLEGITVYDKSTADTAAASLPGPVWVVKAQIHAGGRGKAGGVILCKTQSDAAKAASQMLGETLVTIQTSSEGKKIGRVYIENGCEIADEFYVGAIIDRVSGRVAFMVSTEGGVEIEDVAKENPDKIVNVTIDPATGCQPFHARKLLYGLGLTGSAVNDGLKLFPNLYKAMISTDASMLEINPLVLTKNAKLVALDAKMNFDDNALFRQPDIAKLRDESEEDPTERQAGQHELNYIKLDGSIGCMVNGAGLAMATMDIIKLKGGTPANFLDVGGGATKDRVKEAFKIILSDENVEGVLVNIFGGIMRCDVIAEGIIAAAEEIDIQIPLVVRLEGTNVEEGRKILSDSAFDIIAANDLEDAAKKIVNAISGEN